MMEDVRNTLKPLKWSETTRKITKENSKLPMIVKPTTETASKYGVSKDPVLLHQVWVTQRLVAQNLDDEGAYVVGPQLEIPAGFTGSFQYCHKQKGNDDVVRVYSSVKEIATSLPERVFPLERFIAYPPATHESGLAPDKLKSVVFEPGDQLTVIGRKEVTSIVATNRLPFSGKPKFKSVAVPCVAFTNETTKEIVNLPLTTKGRFSTVEHIPRQGCELDFKDILNEIDLPINLTTCRNCPQTLLDEHFLRPGMRLRITSVEEHEMIIGVTLKEKIIEFARESVKFTLPKYLDCTEDKEQEIVYHTALQRFMMECQIKNSPVNLKDYKMSIRSHISRNLRPTSPKALNQVASSRVCKFNGSSDVGHAGVSAIQLMVSSQNGLPIHARRASLPLENLGGSQALPVPPTDSNEVVPPLPPRNFLRGGAKGSRSSLSPGRMRSARASSYTSDIWDDFPKRPPPPPPTEPQEQKISTEVGPRDHSTQQRSSPSMLLYGEIWESLDDDYLQRLREGREGVKSVNATAYVNTKISCSTENPNEDVASTDEHICQIRRSHSASKTPSPEFRSPAVITSDSERSSGLQLIDLQNDVMSTHPDKVESIEQNPNPNEEAQNAHDSSSESQDDASFLAKIVDSVQIEGIWEPKRPSSVDKSDETSVMLSSCSSEQALEETSPINAETQTTDGRFHISQYSVQSNESGQPMGHSAFTCNYFPAPRDWTPPSDLSTMSVKEVADSLRYIGMNEDTVEWFHAEKVDGCLLCSVEKEMLTQHFHLTPFQCQKIAMFLEGWRPKLA